ncbi:MAG: hypothetical protein HY318_00715, partial [Armatimonadetes bacterium]|nr:hypothetical protein [Armatimonadota bacterium]
LGLTKRLRVDLVSVRLPDFAHPMRETLFPLATGHHQTPVRQLQIVNLPSLLSKVRDSLQTKAAQAKWRGSICLGIPERDQYVTLRRDTRGNFEVDAGRTSPCLELDWRAAARIVFGGLPGEFDHLRSGPFDLLREVFPLEWFFYPADCV